MLKRKIKIHRPHLLRKISSKGLVPLEDLFDSNDVARKPKMEPLRTNIEECNRGTEEKPKLTKISKALPPNEKLKYINLFIEFQDIFA